MYDVGGFGTIFGGLKLSISTTIMGTFMGLEVEIFRPPEIVPKPLKPYSIFFIRQNNLFSVHLYHLGAIPDLSGRNLKGAKFPPPPQPNQTFGHNTFCIYITPFQKNFKRVHRVPGVEIRYLTCLTRTFKFKNFRLFLDFWFRLIEISFFCHIGLGDGSKILKNHISICNHILVDF